MSEKIKNAAAVELGKKRWEGKSKEEKSEHGKMMASKRKHRKVELSINDKER